MVAWPFVGALPSLSAFRLVSFHRWRVTPTQLHRAGSSPGSREGRRKELEPQWRLWEGATRCIRREAWIRSEEGLRSLDFTRAARVFLRDLPCVVGARRLVFPIVHGGLLLVKPAPAPKSRNAGAAIPMRHAGAWRPASTRTQVVPGEP